MTLQDAVATDEFWHPEIPRPPSAASMVLPNTEDGDVDRRVTCWTEPADDSGTRPTHGGVVQGLHSAASPVSRSLTLGMIAELV
eukprot:scaffold17259_cov29-Prasinocladus_malaysianus.AAC.1